MNRKFASVLLAFALAGCFDDVVKDPGFDLWCGSNLCQWQTEAGSIRRVPTWHEDDYGVELVGRPTILSQHIDSFETGPCLKFTLVGDLEAEAEVSLELDFFGDGTPDYSESIPGVHWKRQELLVRMPEESFHSSSFDLKLHKKGTGKAIFAETSAEFVRGCHGDPIVLEGRPVGVSCAGSSDCASGICPTVEDPARPPYGANLCAECTEDGQCGGGKPLCGFVVSPGLQGLDGLFAPYRACVAPGSAGRGEPCASTAACANGVCADIATFGNIGQSTCGDCASDSDCSDGMLCGAAYDSSFRRFRTCVERGKSSAGTGCVAHEECADGVCCFGVCSVPGDVCSTTSH